MFLSLKLILILDAEIVTLLIFDSISKRPVLLDDVHCIGTENTLWECSHSTIGKHSCGENEPSNVAIQCQGI